MKLSAFNPQSKCPKCGHDDIAITYHGYVKYGCSLLLYSGEHLCRYCRRCSYKWAEACPPECREGEVTTYDNLEIHNLLKVLLTMHPHPWLAKAIGLDGEHTIVDTGAYSEMVESLAALTGRLPSA